MSEVDCVRDAMLDIGYAIKHRGIWNTYESLMMIANKTCNKFGVKHHGLIAGGADAAEVHKTSEGILTNNTLIVVDLWPQGDLHVDCSRTFTVGRIGTLHQNVLDTVKGALEFAASLLLPRMPVAVLDTKVKKFIEDKGFGSYVYNHALGHGVGRKIHEAPFISEKSNYDVTIPENGRIAIEPGIYIPGVLGCRFEDTYQITDGNVELLTNIIL